MYIIYNKESYDNLNLVLRSSTNWSAGLEDTEDSIYQAYLCLIQNSEKFIFIENQFFVTSSNERNGRVKNQIGRYLAARIVQAYENNEEFKIYVIIPSVPGKAGKTLV